MHNQKLVAAIKVGGKVLREFGEKVKLPFGSEFEILLKNLNTVQASVKVFIDGKDMTENTALLINPGESLDLKRSISNGNMNSGNAFKFIERSDSVEQHRGIGAEDGLVRIEYQFAIDTLKFAGSIASWPTRQPMPSTPIDPYYQPRWLSDTGSVDYPNITCSNTTYAKGDALLGSIQGQATAQATTHKNDAGITVPGSVVDQKFKTVYGPPLELTKHVMVFQLVGQIEEQQVTQPITVSYVPKCVTCGVKGSYNSKFCSECGTSMIIV